MSGSLNAMSEFAEGEDGLVTSRKLRGRRGFIRTHLPPGTQITPDQKILQPAEGRKTGLYRLCLETPRLNTATSLHVPLVSALTALARTL